MRAKRKQSKKDRQASEARPVNVWSDLRLVSTRYQLKYTHWHDKDLLGQVEVEINERLELRVANG